MSEEIDKVHKYKLTEEDFHYLFSADDNEFENIKWRLGENGNGIRRHNNYIELSDTIIKDSINLRGIKKTNCTNLTLKNVKTKGIWILGSDLDINSNKTNIRFENCEIGRFDMQNSTIGEIHFTNCKIDEAKFRNSKTENIHISRCVIDRYSYIKLCKIKEVHISASIFIEEFSLENCSADFINSKEVVISALDIYNLSTDRIYLSGNCIGDVHLSKSQIGTFSIDRSISGELIILNSQINRFFAASHYSSFNFINSSISQLQLRSCNIPVLEFSGISSIGASITNGQINNLHFKKTNLSKESIISFSGTSIYFLQIEELSMLGNLYFRHILLAIKSFDWQNIEDYTSKLELDEPMLSKVNEQVNAQFLKNIEDYESKSKKTINVIKEATIQVFQSSLGKTEFTDCPLADYRFEFNNSKITDCFVSGGSIPTKNVHIIGTEPSSVEEHQQKASFFNQFKKIFEAQGDIYHATQFQAKWADEQRKLLELIHKEEKGWFNTTFSDLWILKLNKWSNLHGESWPRAFIWILGLGLVFYLPYLFSIGRLFNTNKLDPNLIGYYFEFLNPTHRINFICDGNIVSGWTIAIDVIWRVVVAYLIYQFISAFRKHTKKQ